MAIPRRFLPSMSLLSAFEAAARHESFTAAAEELSVSQSAVSRQIRLLEEQIGSKLFVRDRQTVRLSEAGATYEREIRETLQRIGSASLNLRANPYGGTLNLAILPTFGTRWLAPRLGGFLAAHPGVTINLSTRIRPIDFAAERFDAMIYFGSGDAPDAGHMRLFDERVTACAAPHLLARRPITAPDDLADLQLFQLETRPRAWDKWFAGQGAAPLPVSGMMFDQFALMIEAAIAGLGVALLPHYIAQAEIAAGRLTPVLEPAVAGTGSYWLAWPMIRETYRPLIAFRDWLAAEVLPGDVA